MASASDSLNRPTDSTDIDLLSLALSLLEHMSQLKMHPHRRTLIRLARLHAHLRVASAQTSSPSAVSSSTRPSGSVAVIRTAPQAALNEALRVFASKSAGNGLNGLRPGLLNHLWMYSAGAAFAPLSNRRFVELFSVVFIFPLTHLHDWWCDRTVVHCRRISWRACDSKKRRCSPSRASLAPHINQAMKRTSPRSRIFTDSCRYFDLNHPYCKNLKHPK
jgi:hypothetical protein